MNRSSLIKFAAIAGAVSVAAIFGAIMFAARLMGVPAGAEVWLIALGLAAVFSLILNPVIVMVMRVFLRVGIIDRDSALGLSRVLAQAARGDLSQPWQDIDLRINGDLQSIPFSGVYERLVGVMAEADRMSEQLNRLAQEIQAQSVILSEGAEDQSHSVKDSTAAVSRIEGSTREVMRNVGDLADLSDNVSASTYELQASIEEVNRTVQTLNQSVREVVSAILQITGNMRSVSESAETLSSAASQSKSSMEEIGRATRSIRDRADNAAVLAEAAREGATHSKLLLANAVSKIRTLAETVASTRLLMQNLGVQSRSIGEILNVISSVTADTHLLSLNASIMAAKAGEHGRGFAVVAQEIKTLAMRTVLSAKEIESLILDTQDSVDRSIRAIEDGAERADESLSLSEEVDQAMAEVLKRSEVAAENSRQIAKDTDAQAAMSEQVFMAVDEVSKRVDLIRSAMRDQEESIGFVQKQSIHMKDNMDSVALAMGEQAQASGRISQSLDTLTSRVQGIRAASEDHVRSAASVVGAIDVIRKKADLVAISAQNVNNTSMSVLHHSHLLQHELMGIELPERKNIVTLGILLDNLREERWQREKEMFLKRGESLGANIEFRVAEGNARRQREQADELIELGVKLVILVPVDAREGGKIVENVKAAHIPIIVYDRLALNCRPDLFISFDAVRIGEIQAQSALENAKGKRFLIVAGSPNDQNAQFLYRGQMNVLKPAADRGEIQIVDEVWVPDWDPGQAHLLTRQVLENKGALDAVIAANDGTASGAIRALKEVMPGVPVAVTGMDTELPACRRIVEGTQTMTVYMPIKLQSTRALEAALLMLKGEEIPGITDFVDNGMIRVPSILLRPIKIDRDNLEEVVIKDGFHKKEDLYS